MCCHLESVVDGVVLGDELGGRLLLADAHVGGGEGVGVETEAAGPSLVPEIRLAIWVEDCLALSAMDRVVVDGREIGSLLQGSEQTPEWDHCLCSFCPCVRPVVPREPDPISPFIRLDILF